MTLQIQIPHNALNRSQRRFLASDDWAVLVCGGFGSGKTTALVLKVLQLVGLNPGLPGLVIGATFGSLYATFVAEMERICRLTLPEDLRPKLVAGHHPRLVFACGAHVHLRSAENIKGYDGLSVAWLAGDEIRHWAKKAYDVAIARVRLKHAPVSQRAFASTPAMHWMADEFNTGKRGRKIITAPTEENERNLEPEYIENLKLSYSARMQRAVLRGEFTILEGAVYDSLDLSQGSPWMSNEPIVELLRTRKVCLGFDPGYRRSALVAAVETSPTSWLIFDQIMADGTSAAGVVNALNSRNIEGVRMPIDEIWVDPAADSTDEALGVDVLDVLRSVEARPRGGFLRMLSGYHRGIEYGVERTRVMLGDPENGLPIRVKFHERLRAIEQGKQRGILKDLQAYHYPEEHGRSLATQPLKDGITDHAADCARYLLVGKYLTSPLKSLDPKARGEQKLGYRAA